MTSIDTPTRPAAATGAILERLDCQKLDLDDPLADLRQRFHMPRDVLYFDGNSLGPLPAGVSSRLRRLTHEEWAGDLVSAWNRHGWIDLPRRVGERVAPLIGAAPGEVVVCDSVSVNVFKLLAAALALRPGRPVLVCQADHFPTDLYMAGGLVDLLGETHQLRTARVDELGGVLGEDVAAVCLSHVDFRTGRLEDMAAVTRQIQDAGALAVWDLSHSAGALPVDLEGCGVDLAVGCGYKFLNGGPGAPSFLYVARRHQEAAETPLRGWLGHADPFTFRPDYEPAAGVDRFVCGSPPILSLAAFDAALDAFEGVDLGQVREKSKALGELFLRLVEQECLALGAAEGLEVACPRDADERGSQVTLRHPEGYAIVQALIARGIVGDFRDPDLLRFGLTPLYQRHTDVWDAVAALRQVLETGEHREERFRRRQKVT